MAFLLQDVADLAAKQCGVFARFQVFELGGNDWTIKQGLRKGLWVRVAPGVYAFSGHPSTWNRRLWIAYLTAGERAVVSHQSAAAQYDSPGIPRIDLHLTVPHPDHQRVRGAVVHQTRVLPRHHWLYLFGRRTTTLGRTIVDLAPTLTLKHLGLVYEHGIVTEHLNFAKMSRTVRELMTPSRKGMRKLVSVLDERGPGFVSPASELERRLFEMVARAGLPEPIRQFSFPGRQMVKGCVDGAFVEPKLIIEGDSRRWHTRLADFERDAARDKEAARAGWQTLRFVYVELTDLIDESAATLLETYTARLDLHRRK
jgi:very-short-patch-repair endonuclease